MSVSLWPVGLATVGGALVWTGIQDPPDGLAGVARSLVGGKVPTPGVPKTGAGAAAVSGTVKGIAGGVGGLVDGAGAAIGQAALNVAKTYIGNPYRWGGASHSGIDCSGLTMVAYRDALGVTMPHDCTSQTRRGYKVARDQVLAGDLVAWGIPARYQHIALAAEDGKHCLAAWTYGVKCGYGPIDQTMYGGLPTIFRLWKVGTSPGGSPSRGPAGAVTVPSIGGDAAHHGGT